MGSGRQGGRMHQKQKTVTHFYSLPRFCLAVVSLHGFWKTGREDAPEAKDCHPVFGTFCREGRAGDLSWCVDLSQWSRPTAGTSKILRSPQQSPGSSVGLRSLCRGGCRSHAVSCPPSAW